MAEANNGKPRWAMVIDLDRCTGCEACVVACHAENNVRISGQEESSRGRAINWIRIERYFEGEYPNIRARFMPVLCQHCQEAPCEPVCPVYATYHNEEGLNAQIYNRCVGTRYCANNCPYDVRFFNFFDPVWPEPLGKTLNPEVSVRGRGVMEKCTFCIQRIHKAQDKAKSEGREVEDGEFTTACAQACPTDAIKFGRLDNHESLVSQLAQRESGYKHLEELNTLPRITYLKGERAE
jgi:molybdopterin-containing oxidoreductase family iron-sulfur binding subunit